MLMSHKDLWQSASSVSNLTEKKNQFLPEYWNLTFNWNYWIGVQKLTRFINIFHTMKSATSVYRTSVYKPSPDYKHPVYLQPYVRTTV